LNNKVQKIKAKVESEEEEDYFSEEVQGKQFDMNLDDGDEGSYGGEDYGEEDEDDGSIEDITARIRNDSDGGVDEDEREEVKKPKSVSSSTGKTIASQKEEEDDSKKAAEERKKKKRIE
jgi:hypothetical protein